MTLVSYYRQVYSHYSIIVNYYRKVFIRLATVWEKENGIDRKGEREVKRLNVPLGRWQIVTRMEVKKRN